MMNVSEEYSPLLCQAAALCAEMNIETFPPEVLEKAKYAIMDAVDNFLEGCSATSVIEPVRETARLVPGEATLFGAQLRSAAREAAFFNTVTGSIVSAWPGRAFAARREIWTAPMGF